MNDGTRTSFEIRVTRLEERFAGHEKACAERYAAIDDHLNEIRRWLREHSARWWQVMLATVLGSFAIIGSLVAFIYLRGL